jgi:hypothetical protein
MACEWLAYRSPDLLTSQRSNVRNDSELPVLRAQGPWFGTNGRGAHGRSHLAGRGVGY